MIYVPEYNNGNCSYIYNTDIIRVYQSTPVYNSDINYKDYYIKSGYIYNEGTTHFGNYSTLPTCINSNRITTDYLYRNDITSIMILFLILAFILIYCPYRLFARIFGKWMRV